MTNKDEEQFDHGLEILDEKIKEALVHFPEDEGGTSDSLILNKFVLIAEIIDLTGKNHAHYISIAGPNVNALDVAGLSRFLEFEVLEHFTNMESSR